LHKAGTQFACAAAAGDRSSGWPLFYL